MDLVLIWAALLAFAVFAYVVTVSYTHLDVYKRQHLPAFQSMSTANSCRLTGLQSYSTPRLPIVSFICCSPLTLSLIHI